MAKWQEKATDIIEKNERKVLAASIIVIILSGISLLSHSPPNSVDHVTVKTDSVRATFENPQQTPYDIKTYEVTLENGSSYNYSKRTPSDEEMEEQIDRGYYETSKYLKHQGIKFGFSEQTWMPLQRYCHVPVNETNGYYFHCPNKYINPGELIEKSLESSLYIIGYKTGFFNHRQAFDVL